MTLKLRRAKITDKKLDLPTYNTMMEWIERLANMETDQYFSLDKSAPNFILGLRKFGGSSTVDYSDFALGYSASLDVVTVNSGYLFHGTRTPITISSQNITIANDNTYIYVTYAFGSGSATTTSSLTMPQHTATTLNWLLYLVTLTDGTASIESGNIHHVGDIIIPGSFA